MPAKLFLQLRLLNPSLPVNCLPPAMKLGPRLPLYSSSSAATFSRLFPLRLKHQCLGIQRRRLSTRSDRSRSDFSPARASKSLVDDEAELSAWVSDLNRDSSRGRGDDSDGDFGGRNVRARVKDNRGSRDSFSGKRMINSGSDSEDFDNSSRPRMERGSSSGPFRRNSPTNRQQFDSRRDDSDNGFRKKSPRFQEEGNSPRNVRPDSRSRNENSNSFTRNSQRFDTKTGGGNGEFSTRKSSPRFQDGRLGSSSSVAKRGHGGGRDLESGFRKGGMDSRKQAPLLSEDDDDDEDEDEDEVEIEEVNKLGIGDLLSDDESDSDEEDEVGDVGNVLVKESAKGSARASTGDSESYLSNTRC